MGSKWEAVLTLDILKERLDYNKDTGKFTWRYRENRGRKGSDVGFKEGGYLIISLHINQRSYKYKAHRLAWFFVYGEHPEHMVDHINHDRLDNSISNLRLVTAGENCRNQKLKSSNMSGQTGVYLDKARGKWVAKITYNGKGVFGGRYLVKEEAIEKAKALYKQHGFHQNHGGK